MGFYRKKPTEIEAEQFDGSPASVERIMTMALDCRGKAAVHAQAGILTVVGGNGHTSIVTPGWWVLRNSLDALSVMAPDLFEACWEPIGGAA
jgi:hypothetical protein